MTTKQEEELAICVVLDVTGSMQNQINGTKDGIGYTIEGLPKDHKIGLRIGEFTESSEAVCVGNTRTGCFTSCGAFQMPEEKQKALSYLQSIRLNTPREAPNHKAYGGDTPENVKAGLWKLRECTDPGVPALVFLITDAQHHDMRNEDCGPEAKHEMQKLWEQGVPEYECRDSIAFVKLLCDQWEGGKVFCWPIIYNYKNQPIWAQHFYGELARRTSGMLLCPSSANAQTLSNSMQTVIEHLLVMLRGDNPPLLEFESSVEVFDPTHMVPRERDADPLGSLPSKIMGQEEISRIVSGHVEKFAGVVVGSGWGRRAIQATMLLEQLQLVVAALRLTQVPASNRNMAEVHRLFDALQAGLPQSASGHISLSPGRLGQRLREFDEEEPGPDEECASCISMTTPHEQLLDTFRDSDTVEVENLLAVVLSMVSGVGVCLDLPSDAQGRADFTNSWSAQIRYYDTAIVNGREYLHLVQCNENEGGAPGEAINPFSRRHNNAFLPLAGKDPASKFLYWTFSATQLLNILVAMSLGGSGFVPNMCSGVTAAVFWRIVSSDMSSADATFARRALSSLRALATPPAKELRSALIKGHANASDNPPKLVAALLHVPVDHLPKTIELVLEELLAISVHSMFGKNVPENNAAYIAFLTPLLQPSVFGAKGLAGHDPVTDGLHPLENLNNLEDTKFTAVVRSIYKQLLATEIVTKYVATCRNLYAMLYCIEDAEEIPSMNHLIPNWKRELVQKFLLRFRNRRFDVVDGVHAPASDVPSVEELIAWRVAEVHSKVFHSFSQARQEDALRRAVLLVVEACRSHRDQSALSAALTSLQPPSFERPESCGPGPTVGVVGAGILTLNRNHVPDVMRALHDAPDILVSWDIAMALIQGDWTTVPPSALVSQLPTICKYVECSAESWSLIEQEVRSERACARTMGHNRHGHSVDLPYPGPAGWTEPYASTRTTRLRDSRRCVDYLRQMREFTSFVYSVMQLLDGTTYHARAAAMLHSERDANRLHAAKAAVVQMLSEKPELATAVGNM